MNNDKINSIILEEINSAQNYKDLEERLTDIENTFNPNNESFIFLKAVRSKLEEFSRARTRQQ